MSTTFKERLAADIKAAMKAAEKDKLAVLRLVAAAVKQFEVDQRSELDDERAVDVLTRMVKQRRESISQYDGAGRADLANRERYELELITAYLPAQLDDAAVDQHVSAAIAQSGAASVRDIGKVMAILNAQLKGRADMAAVSNRVKERLAG